MTPSNQPSKATENLIELFDAFLKKWTGDSYPHLIDSDENDGERFREAIRSITQEKEREIERLSKERDEEMERVKACEHIADGEPGWEKLRELCPSTIAVADLRDKFEKTITHKPTTLRENLGQG